MNDSLASAWEPLRGLGAVGWVQEAGLAFDGLYTLLGWGLLFRPQRWRHRGDYNLVDWVLIMACGISKEYAVRSGHTAVESVGVLFTPSAVEFVEFLFSDSQGRLAMMFILSKGKEFAWVHFWR